MTQGEKIYTRIIMDMTKDEIPVIEEDYFHYTGPISLCKPDEDDDDEFEPEDKSDPQPQDKDTKNEQTPNQFEDIKALLQQVANSTKSNAEAIKELYNYQTQHPAPSKDNSQDKDTDKDEPAPENIEMMSRKEYGEYIKRQAIKEFQKELGGLKEEVSTNRQETHEERLRREANELRKEEVGKGKDLDEWRDEIKQLYQQTQGSLSMKRLYQLARSENPEKAKELDKKYAPKEDTKAREPVDDTFGGLVPSNSKIQEAKKKGKLSAEEAGNEAWQIMFGNSDDVI